MAVMRAVSKRGVALVLFAPLLLVVVLLTGAGCAPRRGSAASAEPAAAGRADAPALQPEGVALPCPPDTSPSPALAQAVRDGAAAYEAGRYQDALRLLESADADGSADGIALYRMGYCYSVQGEKARAQETYELARKALEEKEESSAATLEDNFYLVNVLLNQGSNSEAKAAADRALKAIETCAVRVSPGGTASFRVGKLYGDAGKMDRQAAWYHRALAEFAKEPNPPVAYINRAASAVAAFELSKGAWKVAIPELERLHGLYPSDSDIPLSLFIAQLHTGDFDGAGKSVALLRTAGGKHTDELSYLKGILQTVRRMSGSGHSLPDREPDGRPYQDLSNEELMGSPDSSPDGSEHASEPKAKPGLLLQIAKASGEIITAQPEEGSYIVEERGAQKKIVKLPGPALLEKIDALQGRFLAVCLEILRRGLPLQEISFTSGVSPLVVHDWRGEWIRSNEAAPASPSAPAPPPATVAPPGS